MNEYYNTQILHFRVGLAYISKSLHLTVHVATVHILPQAEHARKFAPRNLLLAWPACDEIGSAHAQHATKLLPRMLSMRMQ